ncbi:hypothetical protein [Burkholderia ambifaria]|uniref:Uncharacterized protein n=1 Tax=Burkholderia ambifaria MEX-5 TaxID=396597 RepID=B1TBB7_9BURK|nr:hypothetical protein [Burkholderia ambifaria]EDT39141.1 hypothetical protein BamMEX5DRAFT_5083 [Burkholderia ambifaria MEX-5]
MGWRYEKFAENALSVLESASDIKAAGLSHHLPRLDQMQNDDQIPPTQPTQPERPATAPATSSVDIPGGKRIDFPNGSHLVEGPGGDKYLVSESGDISATVPEIRKVQVDDLAQVLRHEIVHVHRTTSHTLHFVGGGVFSYLHHRDGSGMSIQANRIVFRTLPGAVIAVSGTAPSVEMHDAPKPMG